MAEEGAVGAVDMLEVRLWRRQRSCTSLPMCSVQRARPPRNGAQSAHLPSVETSVARSRSLATLRLKRGTNMRYLSFALATAASIAIATPAVAGPTEDFHALMDDYWAAYLKDNPLIASSVGVKTYDRRAGRVEPRRVRPAGSGGPGVADATSCHSSPPRSARWTRATARCSSGRSRRPDRAQPLRPAAAALLLARQLSRVPCDHGREHPHADQGGLRQLSRAARARARPDEGLRRHERQGRERRLHAGLCVDEDLARIDRRRWSLRTSPSRPSTVRSPRPGRRRFPQPTGPACRRVRAR